jgi:serpin B
MTAIAKSNNAFTPELWGAVRAAKGNLAVSPASITTALAMTWGGARGDTAAEMKKTLHFEGSTDDVLASAGSLLRSWNTGTGPVTLRAANRLFGEKSFSFEKPFLEKTQSAFGAPLEGVDFIKNAGAARSRINGWVAQETQDRIKDLVPPEGITSETRLVLVNAIYFKGQWDSPFEEKRTKPAPFFAAKAQKPGDVATMHQSGTFAFAAKDGVKVLEMPYVGRDTSMVFVLPDDTYGLEAVEQKLSSATIEGWMRGLRHQQVDVALPRFQIDPASSISLSQALQKLGMKRAFTRGGADFTGIANPKNPEERLFISDVFHKAFVKLDEKGTEAAAATAVVTEDEGAVMPDGPPKEFKADHPFLFFLRDTRSGMILFMGRVADPSAK